MQVFAVSERAERQEIPVPLEPVRRPFPTCCRILSTVHYEGTPPLPRERDQEILLCGRDDLDDIAIFEFVGFLDPHPGTGIDRIQESLADVRVDLECQVPGR